MHAKILDLVVYESQYNWHAHQVVHPTWAQIEEAIRRLDKFHYPFLHLWPTLDESQHELVEGNEWFSVFGGEGEYWFAATIGGQWENHYVNGGGGDQEVYLWTSDQGFAAPDKYVCHDLNVVLQAARYYAEKGGYDPSIPWSNDPHG